MVLLLQLGVKRERRFVGVIQSGKQKMIVNEGVKTNLSQAVGAEGRSCTSTLRAHLCEFLGVVLGVLPACLSLLGQLLLDSPSCLPGLRQQGLQLVNLLLLLHTRSVRVSGIKQIPLLNPFRLDCPSCYSSPLLGFGDVSD
ncbi:hypothetical protein Z043_119696 [Scleropages formosus]|uniref:Uncharacterized protein n=1 Tax=Scleropages formosus TaxID=113540 RepID=A0A0P7TWS0_SCLFO|nr:hypothetical protein Z043_119696 [Scleropages formosus]